MPKPRSCNQTIAAAIRKFGLPAVRAAVDMAVELTTEPTAKTKKVNRAKRPADVASEVASA